MNALRPELATLSGKLLALCEGLPFRDRQTLERASAHYERASSVPSAHDLREGTRLGNIILVDLVERDEHGRVFEVYCVRCRSTWCMRAARARTLYLQGRTACRECRRAGR